MLTFDPTLKGHIGHVVKLIIRFGKNQCVTCSKNRSWCKLLLICLNMCPILLRSSLNFILMPLISPMSANETTGEEIGDYYPVFYNAFARSA